MSARSSAGERLVALFLLGLLIFNPPLLSIFAVDQFIAGVPVLYIYLFTTWSCLLGLVGVAARGQSVRTTAVNGGPTGGEFASSHDST